MICKSRTRKESGIFCFKEQKTGKQFRISELTGRFGSQRRCGDTERLRGLKNQAT